MSTTTRARKRKPTQRRRHVSRRHVSFIPDPLPIARIPEGLAVTSLVSGFGAEARATVGFASVYSAIRKRRIVLAEFYGESAPTRAIVFANKLRNLCSLWERDFSEANKPPTVTTKKRRAKKR